jgi:hypothetical protein
MYLVGGGRGKKKIRGCSLEIDNVFSFRESTNSLFQHTDSGKGAVLRAERPFITNNKVSSPSVHQHIADDAHDDASGP